MSFPDPAHGMRVWLLRLVRTSCSRMVWSVACWYALIGMGKAWASEQLEADFRQLGVELSFKTSKGGDRVGYVWFQRQDVSREMLHKACRVPRLGSAMFTNCHVDSKVLTELSAAADLRRLCILSCGPDEFASSSIPRLPKLEELVIDRNIVFDERSGLQDKWPRLRSLDMRCADDVTSKVETVAGHFPTLSEISLEAGVLTKDDMRRIGQLTQLRRLTLKECRFSTGSLSQLAGLRDLRSLDLTDTEVPEADLRALRGLTNLKRLVLPGTCSDAAVAAQWPSLEELMQIHSGVTDESLRSLAQMPHLKELDITGKMLTPQGILSLNDSGLESLSLSFGVPRTRSGEVSLCTPRRLRELRVSFSWRGVEPDKLSLLPFDKMPQLQILDLSDMILDADHLRRLRHCELSELTCAFKSLDEDICSHLLALPYLELLNIRVPSQQANGEWARRLCKSIPFVRINGP